MDPYLLAAAALPPCLAALALAGSRRRFVEQRNLVVAAWEQVGAELARRHDLVPGLVETVRGYTMREGRILAEVAQALEAAVQAPATPARLAAAEAELAGSLARLLAVTEGYPQLRASAGLVSLRRELVDAEDRLQAACRFYNANVAGYNRRRQAFPSLLLARWFRFAAAEPFELEPASRPEVAAAPSRAALGLTLGHRTTPPR